MSSTLESLFEQILHTEQKALEQKSLLNEVKADISKCQADIKDAQAKAETLQGQLVIKVHQWSTAEEQSNSLASQQQILQQQKQELIRQKHETENILSDLNKKLDAEHQKFCQQVQEFSHSYDLISVGQHQREHLARDKIKSLQIYIHQLESDLQGYKKKQLAIDELQNTAKMLQKEVHQKESELQDLEGVLACEQQTSRDQQEERSRVEQIPHTGHEFKKLQAELDACCDDTLEDFCVALQGELEQLQQQQWQKKLQQKCAQQQPRPNRQQQLCRESRNPDQTLRQLQNPRQQLDQSDQQIVGSKLEQTNFKKSQLQLQQKNNEGEIHCRSAHNQSQGPTPALPRGNFQRFTNYSSETVTARTQSSDGDTSSTDFGKNTVTKRPNLMKLSAAVKSKAAKISGEDTNQLASDSTHPTSQAKRTRLQRDWQKH